MRRASVDDFRVPNGLMSGAALLLALFATACGDDQVEQMNGPSLVGTAGVGAGPDPMGRAGAPPTSASRARAWTGIRSCSGSVDFEEIETTSDETSVASFKKSNTRITLSGVDVGPSPELSCRLDLEGVVTMSDAKSSFFESNKQVECTSGTGRQLRVGDLDGHDFDGRPSIGYSLDFSLRIQEPEDPDAGFSPTFVNCTFDLEM